MYLLPLLPKDTGVTPLIYAKPHIRHTVHSLVATVAKCSHHYPDIFNWPGDIRPQSGKFTSNFAEPKPDVVLIQRMIKFGEAPILSGGCTGQTKSGENTEPCDVLLYLLTLSNIMYLIMMPHEQSCADFCLVFFPRAGYRMERDCTTGPLVSS